MFRDFDDGGGGGAQCEYVWLADKVVGPTPVIVYAEVINHVGHIDPLDWRSPVVLPAPKKERP